MDYGCYKDVIADRDLDAGYWRLSSTNTVEGCVMHCRIMGNPPSLFSKRQNNFEQAQCWGATYLSRYESWA